MILDLGLIDYETAYSIQKDLVSKRRYGQIEDSIIFAEHRPIFTIGRGGKGGYFKDTEAIRKSGARVLRVDRGGDITFHGPGQLVIYPIIDLKTRGRDIHRFLRDLEEVVIKFLREFSLPAERAQGRTGVWVYGRKIASIGIGASNWVTYHGIGLNIDCDLRFFEMIYPCGMKDARTTSIAALLNNKVTMYEVKAGIKAYLKDILGVGEEEYERRDEMACVA